MLRKLLVLFAVVCLGQVAKAGDPPYIKTLDGAKNEIFVGAIDSVKDPVFFNPALKPSIRKINSVQNIVMLHLNEFSNVVLPDSFKVSVKVEITYTNINNQQSVIKDSVLSISYAKNKPYKSKACLYFNDALSVSVKIISITPVYTTLDKIVAALQLDNEMVIDRDYNMQCADAAIKTITANTDQLAETGELAVSWALSAVVEAYDLEWTYIDKTALQSGEYAAGGQLAPALIFKNNATRVTINAVSYKIPLLYDGDGMLFYRVRGVQYLSGGERRTTSWSSDFMASGGLGQYDFSGHERKLNWQSDVSFAEEGKRKAVVQYFDGSLLGRQTVTKDNTTNTTVVAETLYDKQGRPAIQVLPAPTLSSIIKYTPHFNTLNTAEYDKEVYDAAGQYCGAAAPAMDAVAGAAQYYSPQNPDASNGMHRFIPNAYGYAFTEIQYTQDATGRVAVQSGAGPDYRLNSNHATRYYYSTPSQPELDALFGTEAGIASHYQKTMVRDANGQYSVSYLDMAGKTIATALAGEAPAGLQALAGNQKVTRTDPLLDASNNGVKGNAIESVKPLLVPAAGLHTFTYALNPKSPQLEDCGAQPICYDCLYDLEITITDDCNNQHLPGNQPYVFSKKNFTLGNIDTTCAPAPEMTASFSLILPEGSYTVTKRLTVSKDAMDYYRDSIYAIHNTCKSYADIYNEQRQLVLQRLGDCKQDSTESHTYTSYREQMLLDLSPPSGQYADDSSKCSFSIFNNVYNDPSISYKDENGADDLVAVEHNGIPQLVRPNELTKKEFVENFKSSWAAALLSRHPEWPLLQKYEALQGSHFWDEDFEKTDTYAEALAKGYLNPTGSSRLPAAKFPFTAAKADPLFSMLAAQAGSSMANSAKQSIESYLFNVMGASGSTPAISAWGLATMSVKCPDATGPAADASCMQWSTTANAFNTAMLCAGDLDMAWRIFRGLYAEKKRAWIDTYIRINGPQLNFDYNGTDPYACRPVFPETDKLLAAAGYPAGSSGQGQHAAGTVQAQHFYADNCQGYVQRWIEQLAPCHYTQADIAAIIPQLVAVCKGGSDMAHPLGASSVAPGSLQTPKSFEEVIKAYNAAHGISYNAACNAFLIDLPKPYEQAALVIDKPLYTKPDSCDCSRIGSLYSEYNSVKSSYASFSKYLELRYHTKISNGALDSLRNLCNGTIQCKYIENPIILPPALQCAVIIPCADCRKVKSLYDQYTLLFPGNAPAYLANEEAQQGLKNSLFERFMNSKLGFNKTADDYLQFMDSCGSTANPLPLSCDSTWTVYSPGANLSVNADLYNNAVNNIGLPDQFFDGEYFHSEATAVVTHYVLTDKKRTVNAGSDTAVMMQWRLKPEAGAYVNPFVQSGSQSWLGATWAKDIIDTSWLIATTRITGHNGTLYGIGISSNAHTLQADWVKLTACNGAVLYFDDFKNSCPADTGPLICGNSEAWSRALEPENEGPCADSARLTEISAMEVYRAYKDSLNNTFNDRYLQKCLGAASIESFTVTAPVQEYHYTLYYYDQAGSLVKTVAPEGVHPVDPEGVRTARLTGADVVPVHTGVTTYRYNSLGQVVSQQSPDGGLSSFWYDRLGRLAVSQNAKQRGENKWSYTLYDALGRITEVGQKVQTTVMTDAISRSAAALAGWLTAASLTEQVTRTVYDNPATVVPPPNSTAAAFKQKTYTLRNRVSYTQYYQTLSVAGNYNSATYYSYDIHGNVDTLLQEYRLGLMAAHGVNRYKLMAYQYDLISGKVNAVHYQPGERDQLYHRYEYDAENRITDVYTTDHKGFTGLPNMEDHEAFYQYYKHGPVARAVIGGQQVQGLDYAYTLQGWLKGVNGLAQDMGGDGKTGSIVAKDAFSYQLNYFTGDYSPIGQSSFTSSQGAPFPGHSGFMSAADYKPLYNGNISSMAVSIPKLGETKLYNYGYDQLNRLVSMDTWKGFTAADNNWNGLQQTDAYKERISYDANGNILTYLRNGNAATGLPMDALTYGYNKTGSGSLTNNRLRHVKDAVADLNGYTEDIKTQTDDNYSYDAIGNLIKDSKEKITAIDWSVYGKILSITKAATSTGEAERIDYTYDASGNRISKAVKKKGVGATDYTWYVRDASGNVMATYNYSGTTVSNSVLSLSEQHLYGSGRLGIWNHKVNMDAVLPIPNNGSLIGAIHSSLFDRGYKSYELSNHLGNVLATVSDRKLPVSTNGTIIDYYVADVVNAQDYYPFGMVQPGREYNNGSGLDYRYSINGQEKEKELSKNITSAEFWMYDSRIGRRWNMDPVLKEFESPYLCFSDNPIFYNDVLGDNADTSGGGKKNEAKSVPKVVQTTTTTDAGHGINGDPGSVSGTGCSTGKAPCIKEAELALKIEDATSAWLGRFGVSNTRTRNSYIKPGGNQVKYRIKKANDANAEILVSFHLDWEKGRTYVNAVFQQSKGSSKSVEFEDNSKKLAGLIVGELGEINANNTAKIVSVAGNTRWKTLGALNRFKGKAATLIEFGSIGDAKNVQLINTNADAIGRQVATGMYLYLYGTRPFTTGNDPQWHPLIFLSTQQPKSTFLWKSSFKF